jgi:hypothetical protein
MNQPVRWSYVVTKPDDVRRVCDTWDECREKVRGRRGNCYMNVYDKDGADAILSGRGLVLAPGRDAFADANGLGGIGVVIVRGVEGGGEPDVEKEITTSGRAVFKWDGIGLGAHGAIPFVRQPLRPKADPLTGRTQ